MQFYWLSGFCKNDTHPIFRLQHGFAVLFKQLAKKDEAIFKQLLKTVHPILKTTRKASSSEAMTRLSIKVSMLLRPIPESKPTKDGMEGYSL
jgi:hypothetical protein